MHLVESFLEPTKNVVLLVPQIIEYFLATKNLATAKLDSMK